MKLNELELYKSLKNKYSIKDAINIFKQYGWKVLGHGVESAVAMHPTKPYVLKLFRKKSKYSLFVELVHKHPNRHFPKFGRYTRYIDGTKWAYVRMEKLIHLPNDDISKYSSELAYLKNEIKNAGHLCGQEIFSHITPDAKFNHLTPEYKKACQYLIDMAVKHPDIYLDLSEDNLMLRGMTLVFNDPYF